LSNFYLFINFFIFFIETHEEQVSKLGSTIILEILNDKIVELVNEEIFEKV